ncbi:MAG TPA: DoxX family protein [Gemmatimonadaceae bacterium]
MIPPPPPSPSPAACSTGCRAGSPSSSSPSTRGSSSPGPEALAGTTQLGYPASVVFPLGVLQLVLLVCYLVPRTAPLGAILWTGYLGGAIATHVRLLNPLFTHILFPVYVAALLWGGLWLRDARVRALLRREDRRNF